MSDWVKRPYDPLTDEAFVVSQWLSSWAAAPDHAQHGALMYGTEARQAYWARMAPVVEAYLEIGRTEVICAPDDRDVLAAFACTNGNVVHYVSVKREYRREGYSEAMVRDLLGELLDTDAWYTCDPVEISTHMPRSAPRRMGVATCGVAVPALWRPDPHWLARQARGGERKRAA